VVESPPHNGAGPAHPLAKRRAGLLLHPTSLPGAGRIGQEARQFVDFVAASGFSVWQVLPLGPTHDGGSPYQCLSVFAGNPALIGAAPLQARGWLREHDVATDDGAWLDAAAEGFAERASEAELSAYQEFAHSQRFWLEDYCLYRALKADNGERPWWEWPSPIRERNPDALDEVRQHLATAIRRQRFQQFVFFEQWQALKHYANERGVLVYGDMPIFVAEDSADVWARREYFALDDHGRPEVVAGVPPDYFSETGQRWGNPHYRWEVLEADGFDWWVKRVRVQLELCDLLRVDHFRGFEAYWEISAQEQTAVNGRWVQTPGGALLQRLHDTFGYLPLVAEDLGIITPEVDALRERFGLPGMKVLQFAFGSGPDNPYLPHNHVRDCAIYTGTHDNDTTLGWYETLDADQRREIREYLGNPAEPMPWPLIRSAMASHAALCVVPMQDVLGLDSRGRMNTPGTSEGNWQWRFAWEQLPAGVEAYLREMIRMYGRLVCEPSGSA
jgi:4-alpha-glucanotransferase